MSKQYSTPRSDYLEQLRIDFKQERTPAYGDVLALCRQLERELTVTQRELSRLEDELFYYRWRDLENRLEDLHKQKLSIIRGGYYPD